MLKTTLIALLVAVPVTAHEFWLEPSAFAPQAGRVIDVRLLVGDGFPGERYARNESHIRSFLLYGPHGRIPVAGRPGADPAGRVRIPKGGADLIAYRSNTTRIELPARKFEAYLVEEGLEAIVAERKRRGESGKKGREIFSRCAKALLGKDRAIGFTLEIVSDAKPRAGIDLPVRVLYQGKPLAGALVRAFPRDRATGPTTARTDASGRARIPLPRAGVWMLGCVHMRRADKRSDADWESLWASLTFEAAPALPRELR